MKTNELKLIVTAAINEHLEKIIEIKHKDTHEEDLYTVKVLHLIKGSILKQLPELPTLNSIFTKINHDVFEVHYVSSNGLVMKCQVDQANEIFVQIDTTK